MLEKYLENTGGKYELTAADIERITGNIGFVSDVLGDARKKGLPSGNFGPINVVHSDSTYFLAGTGELFCALGSVTIRYQGTISGAAVCSKTSWGRKNKQHHLYL